MRSYRVYGEPMKLFLLIVLVLPAISIANDFQSEFEKGFYEGKKSCSQEYYFSCSANLMNAKLIKRSIHRGTAIKALFDYCESPSRSVYRRECQLILNNNINCIKI